MTAVINVVRVDDPTPAARMQTFTWVDGSRIVNVLPSDLSPWSLRLVVEEPHPSGSGQQRHLVWVRTGAEVPDGQHLGSVEGPRGDLHHLYLLDENAAAQGSPSWAI